MSKKRKRQEEKEVERSRYLKEETVNTIYAILFFVLAVFLMLSRFKGAGVVGDSVYNALSFLLGVGYYLLPTISLLLTLVFMRGGQRKVATLKLIAALVLLFSSLGIVTLAFTGQGGVAGNVIALPLLKLFDSAASYVILISISLIALVTIIDRQPKLSHFLFWRKNKDDEEEKKDDATADLKLGAAALAAAAKAEAKYEPEDEEEPEKPEVIKISEPKKASANNDSMFSFAKTAAGSKPFVPPPLSLLEHDRGKPGVGDIKANANIIKRTLQNFGIVVEMDEISIGPSVTRYALKPAEGVKLSRIVALQNDLSLALAAHPIRIEAPIPGKSLVGIEIPNSTKTTVGLASLLSESEYQQSEKPLLISLGRGISGLSYFTNLAKAPHLLIAGATGSGKSVTIHAILTSLLYRNSPDNLKFIMIDPKRVELTLYNKIPHLLTPVITDAKKAILSLKWAAKEMDRRYDLLETEACRDIDSYHKKTNHPELMPYLVVVIDELADIMQSYPRELESAIVRLAQMSRAVGIHLILSTQRPSVNVITGLIKANVPSRIALQVTSQIDSRTILDTGGAEKLLGAGDMLFMSGDMSKPQRIQSSFISETELKKVVKYFADNYANEVPQEINMTGTDGPTKDSIFESSFDDAGDGEEDDLYEEARQIVVSAGKASTSYIQRKLRVGYARAARLIDMLEERGVVGPGEGSKPRDVINAGGDTGTGAVPATTTGDDTEQL